MPAFPATAQLPTPADAPSPGIDAPAVGARTSDASPSATRRPWWLPSALAAILILPLVVAVIALRRTTWYPVLDLAMTELRVRDVGTVRTPLIGLPGRIGRTLADQGSHPGPLSFYLLAPVHRLLGRSAWALQVGTVVIHGSAMTVALLIARRRGGTALLLGLAAMLALLTKGYGLATLTEPWNPYLPLLWWIVFLLAVWSVVAGDVILLPVAVFAASFCAQTHVPYLAMTAGLGALAAGAAAFAVFRATAGGDRRRALGWMGVALVVGVVLWAPPLIDQAINRPGNLSRLATHFADPPEPPVGLAKGIELELLHLDLSSLASGQGGSTGSLVTATSEPTGSVVPGLALLGVWSISVLVAVARHRRRRVGAPRESAQRGVLGLHLVVAAGLVMSVLSMSRIFGDLWYYLMLWAWGVTALLVLAVGWTAALLIGDRIDGRNRPTPENADRARIAGAVALGVITLVASVSFAIDATDAEPPAPRLSATLGAVVGPTAAALAEGVGAADGRAGRYVITWEDALHIGSQAYGLVSELERRGFRVGMTEGLKVPNTKYRVVDPKEATAEVHFATGLRIAPWRELPDVIEVASIEPRTNAEIAEFERLRAQAISQLRSDGLDDVVPLVDDNLFAASIQHAVPPSTRKLMARMLDLGEPTSVFIAPPGTTP